MNSIPDVHRDLPKYRIPLNKVGIHGVEAKIVICGDICREYNAFLNIYVDLSPSTRGIHLSRLTSCLKECVKNCRTSSFREFLQLLAKRIMDVYREIRYVEVELETKEFIESMEPFVIKYSIRRNRNEVDNWEKMSIELIGLTACPCAQKVYSYFENTLIENTPTHMQRTKLEVTIKSQEIKLDPIELASRLLECFSSPIRTVLKRVDEYKLIKKALSKPLFAEDVAREALAIIHGYKEQLSKDTDILVRVYSMDSIHPFNVYSEASFTIGELEKYIDVYE